MLARTTLLTLLTALTALGASTDTPVWFSRIPSVLLAQDLHDTSYLQCKLAHNGRTEWPSDSSTDTAETMSDHAGRCTRCFCLPDTQQIGCAPVECPGEKQLVRRHRVIRGARPGALLYVNHEACVKAKEAAAHRGMLCVCRQNGALECAGK